MNKAVYAEPRTVTDINDCYFYHTMEIPNYGLVRGEWDLRGGEASYLGNVNVQGKQVLEIGTASGFLCFTMEKMGAEVVAYDLSDEQGWDIVPYAGFDFKEHIAETKQHLRKLNNGFWLAHKAFNSKAKVVYGAVYDIPDEIGQFDICTFGSILLHVRDPFLALQRVTAHVTDTVIVTDVIPKVRGTIISAVEFLTDSRLVRFVPNAKKRRPFDTWWHLSPRVISEFLHILGFPHQEISHHRRGKSRLFTVVGRRARPRSSLSA